MGFSAVWLLREEEEEDEEEDGGLAGGGVASLLLVQRCADIVARCEGTRRACSTFHPVVHVPHPSFAW